MKLYTYWRSSAAYRVRIALALKGVSYENGFVNIAPGKLEQKSEAYAAVNPQMRVPSLELPDGSVLGQSMAIMEWLDETYREPPLLPAGREERARCRAFADLIACDIHPLNNSSVLADLKERFGADGEAIADWYRHWISVGFTALETLALARPGDFLFGDAPSLAEVCLVPQVANARRFETDLSAFPRLVELDARCRELDAFKAAAPENQPDAG